VTVTVWVLHRPGTVSIILTTVVVSDISVMLCQT